MPNRRHRSRRRYSADFVEGGATFGGFEVIGGVGRAKAVWKRPDHLDAPDAEAPLGPLERLGPVGASVTAVALVAALVGGLVAGFGRSADESASARDPRPAVTEPVAAAVPQAAEAPPV
ncbi:MAG TPA: hypothetical protein VLH10_20820, partial [Yinghuangia sp.]|nr:hypothetical protein [Yinghuangia sp.]